MSTIPANVLQVLLQLVPASIIKDIACFVFYDNHPRDKKNIDVVLCTKMGDVREYYQRDLLSSINVESTYTQTNIKILRNSQCDLFFLLFGGDELTILSRKEKLQLHHKLTNVSKYEISDSACSGQATLKVFHKDNNIPVIPDDNFENFRCLDFSLTLGIPLKLDSDNLITNLKRKLTEAKYNVKSNEQTYQEFLNLRHSVAFSIYKEIHPNLEDSQFKDGLENLAKTLKIETQKPWIKTCNKKIVIIYFVCNRSEESIEDVHIILHGTTRHCIEYTTKLFEKTNTPPFWNETKSQQILKPNTECAIVAVIDLDELKYSVVSRIEFNGVISFKKAEKECIVPMDDVILSSLDNMGEQFDVLSSDPMESNIMLAVLASTEKTDLVLRHIKTDSTDQYYLSFALFCKYLDMEKVPNAENIVMYRKSPYHVLNGLMIVSHSEGQGRNDQLAVTVHSRSPSQVLALIHHIHNAVPYPIVTTTPDYKVSAKNDMLSVSNEVPQGAIEPTYNYTNYASSMLNRTALVIEYLDKSMIQMSESKNSLVWSKIGSEIDLFAQGEAKYKEFKQKMWEEAAKGVKMLNEGLATEPMSDEMFID